MKTPAVTLLSPKILVRPGQAIERKQGGVIIPLTVNQALEEGTVVLISDGVLVLKNGDSVLYPRGAGVAQEFDGVNYKILNGPTTSEAGEIWAVV